MKPKASTKSRNTKVRVIASRPSTMRQPSSPGSISLRSASERSFAIGLAERVGGLDDVRTAADRIARREQHEAPGREGQLRELAAGRDVAGDVDRRGVAQPGERHVGQE